MKYRKLRIAWSVGCGIVGLLLIALWVRSFRTYDSLNLRLSATRCFTISSIEGTMWAAVLPASKMPTPNRWWLGYGAVPKAYYFPPEFKQIPIWIFASGLAAFAALPWLRWRFSLRTLLIATTVVAVVLGAVVLMLRGS